MDTLESICCFKEYMFYEVSPRRVDWYVNILACKARWHTDTLVDEADWHYGKLAHKTHLQTDKLARKTLWYADTCDTQFSKRKTD